MCSRSSRALRVRYFFSVSLKPLQYLCTRPSLCSGHELALGEPLPLLSAERRSLIDIPYIFAFSCAL